ncbi:MAG: FtsX-like permease family protein [Actinobacteria bacterium]|nr:MAG: FtsX-like permease family protein [Actinomycetota bacterium]
MYLRNLWCFTLEVVATARRRRLVAMATVSTGFIALLVLSATIVGAINLASFSSRLRSSAEVTVFLEKDLDERARTAFEAWLAARPSVADYDYISPSSALAELASQLGQDARLIEAAGGNPIPPSFRIRASAPEQARVLARELKGRPEVYRMVYASEATARLLSLSRLLSAAGIALSLLLGVASITIVHNAMAVAIDARRRDIRIMHLVGADPRLIRLPYLIHGVLYGAAAAAAAALVTLLAYVPISSAVTEAIPVLPMAPVQKVALVTIPATLLCGSLFGLIGASLSVSRHLQTRRSPKTEQGEAERGAPRAVKLALALLVLVIVLTGAAVVRADAGVIEDIGAARRLSKSIDTGQRRIRGLSARLERGAARLSRLEKEIGRVRGHIAEADTRKRRLSKRMSNQLFAYYAAHPTQEAATLTQLNTLDTALVASERLRFILSSERSTFDSAKATLADLEAARRRLSSLRATAARTQDELAEARTSLRERVKRQKRELTSLTASIRRTVAVYGKGPADIAVYGRNGFIFPVAAPHSFSNDWHNQRVGHLHQGTDIFAAQGAPLLSVVAGRVRLDTNRLGGTVVHLSGQDGNSYYYAHMSGYAPGVSSGQQVAAGELLGFVGTSGNAAGTPPHLHFEIHPGGGAAVNPFPILSAADSLLLAR